MVTKTEILKALDALGLQGATVCVHGSLRSFGAVDGGADMLVDALCAHGRTVVMPTFYYQSYQRVPEAFQIANNGLEPLEKADPNYPPPVPYEPDNPASRKDHLWYRKRLMTLKI